jgi:hypothetical protein
MKKLLLLFVILTLLSCEKDSHNFSCDCVYTFYSLDGKCHWTMTRTGFPQDNKSYKEIHDYMNTQAEERYLLMYGQLWRVSGECNCVPYYCPEY